MYFQTKMKTTSQKKISKRRTILRLIDKNLQKIEKWHPKAKTFVAVVFLEFIRNKYELY